MGIEKFLPYIDSQGLLSGNPGQLPNNITSLSLDLNAIVYTSIEQLRMAGGMPDSRRRGRADKQQVQNYHAWMVDRSKNQQQYIDSICRKVIENIIRIANIVNSRGGFGYLFLAMDGLAPFAKNIQQRIRRERSSQHISLDFDTNAITAGTTFMTYLDQKINEWINDTRFSYQVIFSGHLSPGEGEHKIFQAYKEERMRGDGYHIIHGLDSDFFILSLASGINNIVLMREYTPENLEQGRFDDNKVNFFYIDTFKKNLSTKYPIPTIHNDFIVLSYLIGNDFLPVLTIMADLRMYNAKDINPREYVSDAEKKKIGFNMAFVAYMTIYEKKNVTLTFPDSKHINMETLKLLFTQLASVEPQVLNRYYEGGFKSQSIFNKTLQALNSRGQRDFDYDLFRTIYYQDELYAKGNEEFIEQVKHIRPDLYDQLRPSGQTMTNKIFDMASIYINGIYWNYVYYVYGVQNISSVWAYQYHKAPLLRDIVSAFNNPNLQSNFGPFNGMVEYGVWEQLLTVIPQKSHKVLPRELQKFYHITSDVYDWYPETYNHVETFMIMYSDQYIPITPIINPYEVSKLVKSMLIKGPPLNQGVKRYVIKAPSVTYTTGKNISRAALGEIIGIKSDTRLLLKQPVINPADIILLTTILTPLVTIPPKDTTLFLDPPKRITLPPLPPVFPSIPQSPAAITGFEK